MRRRNVTMGVKTMTGVLALTLGLAAAAGAQQPPQDGRGSGPGMPPPPGEGARGPGRGFFGPGRPGEPGGRMMGPLGGLLALTPDLPLAGLNLSDAQREQVRALMQGRRGEGRAMMERARAAMEAMEKATTGTTIDDAAAIERGQALGAVIGEAAVLRARLRNDVMAILTPEQQAEARAMAADRMEKRRQGVERMPPPRRPRPDGVPPQ